MKAFTFKMSISFIVILSAFALILTGCGNGNGVGAGDSEITIVDIGKVEPLDPSKVVTDPQTGQQVVNDQVLITFKDTVSEDAAKAKIAAINGEIVGYIKGMNDYQVRISGNPTLDQLKTLIDQLNNDPDVEVAALNFIYEINRITPNDPKWNDEWNEEKPGGRNWGLEAIYMPSAWEYNSEMDNIKIGVIDAGFRIDHEDLKIHSDNAYGSGGRYYSVEADDPDCFWRKLLGPRYKDYNNHGTHVAGTIGALSNNAEGITGILWKRDMYLYRTDFQWFDIKYGMVWLLEKGAKVINMSFGVEHEREPSDGGTTEIDTDDERSFIETPRKYWTPFMERLTNNYDFLIVRSAGNDGIDAKWGGSFSSIDDIDLRKRIIIVGAIELNWLSWLTGPSYSLARDFLIPDVWTNFGPMVDVVAPGEDIYSTIYYDPYYKSMSGTSMAAPHVTGVAGLVWAINPDLTPEQVKNIIVGSADRPVSYEGRPYRILNAKAAVEWARSAQATEPIPPPLTGVLIGKVRDATTNDSIKGAHVSVFKGGSYYGSTVSQWDGSYVLILEPGIYTVTVGKDGYIPENKTVTVTEGVTTYTPTLRAIPSGNSGVGGVEGRITNAFTGEGVNGLTINFRRGIDAVTGDIIGTTTTDADGFYRITLPAGNYTGEITGSGYSTGYFLVVSIGRQTTLNQNAAITPILSPGETRIILTWGETPRDLDSHLTGPAPDGSRFHIYYADRTYTYAGTTYADLDLDDVTSYGPETITIYQQISGVYRYSVHDFSNRFSTSSYALSNSGAQVRVYRGSDLVATYNVPSGQGGTLWTVFEMDGDTITPINAMSYESSPVAIQSVPLGRSITTDMELLRNLPPKR